MHRFVLFSVILIAASVIVLLLPFNNHNATDEGFKNNNAPLKRTATSNAKGDSHPTAAGQRNSSSTAGAADGSSSSQHLLDHLLQKHDRLAEAFENRDASKANGNGNGNGVSTTTTQKKGIASTGASYNGDEVTIPVAGCNKDKCVEIGKIQPMFDPMAAIDGNCVNPTLPNGEPDYSTKHCAAFRPRDYAIDAQECLTCGYYTYKADCVKYADPNNPTKCILYGDYKFQQPDGTKQKYRTCDADDTVCNLLAGGSQGGQDETGGSSGPSCSTCELDINPVNRCVLPGCYSDGLPFPDDDGYNFAEGCFDYDPSKGQTLPGMQGRAPGYYCPPITQGRSYDGGGNSGDPCYTNNGSLSYAKYVMMDKVCSNDKPKSQQRFVPGKDAPIDGNDNSNTKHRSGSKTGATISHQHQHGGAINVYHHHMNSSGSKNTKDSKNTKNSKNTKDGKNTTDGKNTKDGEGNKNQGYMEPVAGAGVLGFL